MTLRQIEVLRAVIRFRTTLAAARELGLSQPAVSNAIRGLESQLGFALFERVNNLLFPTKDAQDLYADAEPIFVIRNALETRMRDLREIAAVVRPFRPVTTTIAYAAWSRTRPLSRLAEALLKDINSCAQLWEQRHGSLTN